MAIDPTQITTVNAEELPVAPITAESIIVHSIGGVLYRGTVAEILPLVPSVNYQPFEVKQLNVSNLYVTQNFDEDGLGKTDGLWNGWAIINGNNGTGFNCSGATFIGFGDIPYDTMRQQIGENTKAITKNNVPKMDLTVPVSGSDNAGGSHVYVMATNLQPEGNHTYVNSVNPLSTETPLSIMQKSFVQLFIMKLP